MKKAIITIAIILLVLALAIIFIYVSKNKTLDINNIFVDLPACPESKELFTYPTVHLEDIQSIIPLGNVSPPGHTFPTDHVYFTPPYLDKNDPDKGVQEVNVYAPGNITITSVREIYQEFKGRTDYTVKFSACQEVDGFFIHLESLSDKITQEIDFEKDCSVFSGFDNSECSVGVEIKMTPGDLIGTAGGEGINNFDLGVNDTRVQHEYANPKRWNGRSNHNVCPFDYFTQDLKDKYYVKLGTLANNEFVPSKADPVCGTIEQDVPGTAQGVWFLEETSKTYPENKHLALIPDNFDASNMLFSVGESIEGINPDRYYFVPESEGNINRDFRDIMPGDIYCHETSSNYDSPDQKTIFLTKMLDEETIKIEYKNANTCNNWPWEFSDQATILER